MSGVIHDFTPAAQDWWSYEGLRFWLRPDGSGRSLTVQFRADSFAAYPVDQPGG